MKLISPRLIVGNRGDLLSRYGILEALQRLGNLEITSFCQSIADLGPLTLPTLPYGPLYNLWPGLAGQRALRKASVVVWTGGLDLQDDSSLLKLIHTWLTFLHFRALGCRIVVLMQGAGPLTTRAGKSWTRRILSLVDCFVARDSGSLRLLRELAPAAPLIRGHDGIFLEGLDHLRALPSEEPLLRRLTERPAGQRLIGVNIRLWFHFNNSIVPYHLRRIGFQERSRAKMDRLVEATTLLVGRLRQNLGARVVLLSMYEPGTHPWEDDLPYLRRVKEGLASDSDVVLGEEGLSLGGFGELVRRLDLMIGSRLHSTLAALRLGVPAINLSYTNKCRDIFTDLGMIANGFDLESFMNDPGPVVARAEELFADQHLRATIRQLVRTRIQENEQILRQLFGKKPEERSQAA